MTGVSSISRQRTPEQQIRAMGMAAALLVVLMTLAGAIAFANHQAHRPARAPLFDPSLTAKVTATTDFCGLPMSSVTGAYENGPDLNGISVLDVTYQVNGQSFDAYLASTADRQEVTDCG